MVRKSEIVTLPIAELVEDLEVYPRHAVDDANVQGLALALEAGCQLPPVVAEKSSKIIVDGWHRVRAYRRVHGTGASIEVELRSYPDRRALLEDAIAMNAAHGRRLDAMDVTRAALMLEKAGTPPARISVVMHLPEERIRKILVRVARSDTPTRDTVPGTKKITLKRCVAHLQGKKLTEEQAEAHESLPGTSFLLVARQITLAAKTGMLNLEDEKLVQALRDMVTAVELALGATTA